ncbi:MAG: ATP-binding protein [Pseudomonadota bacterium]
MQDARRIALRDKQLEQLRCSMWRDCLPRNAAAAFAMAVAAYLIESWFVLVWLVPYLLTELALWRLLDRTRSGGQISTPLLSVLSFLNSATYLVPGALLWMEPEVHEKASAMIYIAGGMVNVSTIRAPYLRAAFGNALAFVFACLFLPIWLFVETGDYTWSAMLACGVVGLLGYFANTIATTNGLVRQLLVAEEKAEAASRAKSQFLASMSHEIRTPLNGILGVGYLLQEQPHLRHDPSYYSLLMRSGRTLLALLDDVIDMASVEAQKVRVTPMPARLQEDIESACNLFESLAREKGIAFTLDLRDVPQMAVYDPLRLRQIVMNVISNAVKFTNDGAVSVEVERVANADGTDHLAVTVCDTGPGFEAALLQRPFVPFQQGLAQQRARLGGTGLGMAITEQLLSLLGGSMEIENRVGGGATVRLRIPIETMRGDILRPDGTATPLADVEGLSVLIVDDIHTNRFIARRFLCTSGLTVREASSGPEALAMLETQMSDIVMLDIHMPAMTGEDVLEALCRTGKCRKTTILAMTADAMEGDRERYLALGFDGYVSKPLEKQRLVAEIHRARTDQARRRAEERIAG